MLIRLQHNRACFFNTKLGLRTVELRVIAAATGLFFLIQGLGDYEVDGICCYKKISLFMNTRLGKGTMKSRVVATAKEHLFCSLTEVSLLRVLVAVKKGVSRRLLIR